MINNIFKTASKKSRLHVIQLLKAFNPVLQPPSASLIYTNKIQASKVQAVIKYSNKALGGSLLFGVGSVIFSQSAQLQLFAAFNLAIAIILNLYLKNSKKRLVKSIELDSQFLTIHTYTDEKVTRDLKEFFVISSKIKGERASLSFMFGEKILGMQIKKGQCDGFLWAISRNLPNDQQAQGTGTKTE